MGWVVPKCPFIASIHLHEFFIALDVCREALYLEMDIGFEMNFEGCFL